MKKEDVNKLLQRFLSAREENKEPYFDADECVELLNRFEDEDEYVYYEDVLALGLRLHPGNIDLQIKKCRQYMYHDEIEKALESLEFIAENKNEDLDLIRLECYCMAKEYGKVVEYTEWLISNQCEYLETVFEYIAPILNDLEMYKDARDYIDRGLLLFPDNLILKDELCYIMESEGDLSNAIELCNQLIDKNPYSYEYWFTLGRLYSMEGDFDKAIEAFDFALTCDDSDSELKILKAYCLYMNESYQRAIEIYNEISSDEKDNNRIQPLIAECYIKLDDFEQAYQLLKELVSGKEVIDDPTIYINFIHCCVETDREQEASEILQHAAGLFPDNVRILSLLALTYLESGKEDLAMNTTNQLFHILENMDENEEDSESLFRAAQYLYLKGEVDKALKYYQKVFELDPTRPFMHIHMAMAYLSKGDIKNFSNHYRQASPKEMIEYLKKSGVDLNKIDLKTPILAKPMPLDELIKEYLNNKDNSN
ncbi:tetratricopeptide repeat protein [Parabacteroides sp. PF5-9]|uniref:tetratricopeptide repeat protein n=1 Tax=Parabacteroides sp. PF5-9 TaxID=1742404 RepID=UPI0024733EFC|nr:tetratricopeptide repeat protein [Parabacteroides sp. PF5-9]MDH6356481.1 tetratricopeptide (TPR) repeat protein [Parabacteroides sp. PF5-9]